MKNQDIGGVCLRRGALGQIADLRGGGGGGLTRKGDGVNTLMHILALYQQTCTCSMSTKEVLEKRVKYFEVNNKNTRTTTMMSF